MLPYSQLPREYCLWITNAVLEFLQKEKSVQEQVDRIAASTEDNHWRVLWLQHYLDWYVTVEIDLFTESKLAILLRCSGAALKGQVAYQSIAYQLLKEAEIRAINEVLAGIRMGIDHRDLNG